MVGRVRSPEVLAAVTACIRGGHRHPCQPGSGPLYTFWGLWGPATPSRRLTTLTPDTTNTHQTKGQENARRFRRPLSFLKYNCVEHKFRKSTELCDDTHTPTASLVSDKLSCRYAKFVQFHSSWPPSRPARVNWQGPTERMALWTCPQLGCAASARGCAVGARTKFAPPCSPAPVIGQSSQRIPNGRST
jgi:hypothetical protein